MEKGIVGVNRICFVCGISKATYYNATDSKERFLAKYEAIKQYVTKIIAEHSSYGIRRIHKELQQKYAQIIGRDTLGKLLILWGLQLKRKIQKKKISVIQKILIKLSDKVNLLIRTKITKPLQAITSDITEIIYNNGKGKCYLAVHKDVFGQMVYGHKLGETMETYLVRESFKQACKQIKLFVKGGYLKTMLFHQDQGSQYTSYQYVEDVLSIGTLSYSTPGTPTENPGQESFFGRFKDEWKDEIWELKSFTEVKRFVDKKICYYNTKRLHTSIGYQTPAAYTKSVLKCLR